jgi:DNA-binding transcriptional LysR family regulator
LDAPTIIEAVAEHVTVGRRIALLEKRLGVTVLQRTPDGFDVTSAGEGILRRCIAMENAALDLERAAAGRDSLAVGSIRLTATEALAHRVIAPAIAELRKNHPDLRVDLAVGVRSLDIARREADLAVRVGRPSGSGLVCRKLGEVGYSLYASRSYIAKHRTPQRGEGLAGHDLITFTGAPVATSPFFMNESLDEARIALRCDNPLIQVQAAAKGIGIAELACFLGDDCADLVRIWPGEPPALRSVWLVLHEDLRRSARIRVGQFAMNREISVCVRLRGGVGRTRTSDQSVIVKRWAKHGAAILPTSTIA